MAKKFMSAVLCAALVMSSASVTALSASADTAADYGLASKTSDGVILHAFDWSFSTIKENLPAIAQAGYTTVQTSPVQAPKDYGDSWNDTANQWWKLYQPLSFSVATKNSWIGTKSELKTLCEEADKYGIKIICDIVSNHMAAGDSAKSISNDAKEYEPELYADYEKYFHTYKGSVMDSNTQSIVQGKLSQLPDLNTGDEFVQSRVISLLKECIDCGVDGFRFDAAKHIETPDDGDYGSNFWPNVVNSATEYAKGKGVELYCYGEILNTPGNTRSTTSYTKYLDVTDNKTGDTTLNYVVSKNADKTVKAQSFAYNDKSGASPSDFVMWAESHDTYMGDSGSGGIGNTSGISNEDIVKTWAIVAARSETKPLYFARPGVLMDQMGDTEWKSTAVTEINRFHNKFIGVADEIYNDGDVVAVQRGTTGIVLVNLGSNSSVSVTTKGMKDGTYTDAISGTTFTVSNGKISGKIGSTGVAVVYEGAQTTPKANFSVIDKTSFKTDTMDLTITLDNAASGTYSINGAAAVSFTGSTQIKLGSGIDSGDITVKVTATNGTKTTEVTQTYTKVKVEHTGNFVYFNLKGNKVTSKWKNAYIYAYYEEKDSSGKIINTTTNGAWPGVPMDYNEADGVYYYELPKGLNIGEAYVIFTDGAGNQTQGIPVTANNMIYDNDKFYVRGDNAVTLVYGDIDGSGDIDSLDSLLTLRASINLENLTEAQKKQADVDGDEQITSADALSILRYSVDLVDKNTKTGEKFIFNGEGGSEEPKPENVFYLYNKAGWLFDDGCKLWLVNTETNEALETTKESPLDDKSTYSYIELPSGWKNVAVYRTKYSDNDIKGAYNHWICGEIPAGSKGIEIKSNTKFEFVNYTPDSK